MKVGDVIRGIVNDPSVTVTNSSAPKPSPPSPVDNAAYRMIDEVAKQIWPGVVTVPEMSTGATDGLWVRNAGVPVYGAMGLFGELGVSYAHGKDERVNVANFYEAVDQWYAMMKRAGAE
jgi:acetylornithine deacetylase/succinyl-diaminopimelate desuccinylase-like protein